MTDDWIPTDADVEPGALAIVGVGESEHTRASGRTTHEIIGDAVERALDDAGLAPSDVDGILHGTFPDAFDAAAFHTRFGTSHDVWSSKAGGGMTYAATAPVVAAARGGVVVDVFGVAWATQRSQMVGGPGQVHADDLLKRNLELPYGWFPQPAYFATIARRHMHEHGTTEEDLGAVAVASRANANRTPGAVMHGRPLTLDDYLDSPPLVSPLRKEDCSLISDGGGAFVLAPRDRAADLRHPVVEVAAVAEARSPTRVHWAQQRDLTSTPQAAAAPVAFARAGITPDDVDVYACYDPFTIVTLMQLEDSGFCGKGEGGELVRSGSLPVNTHGGLLSHAYVLGIAHVVELVRQLRGEAANQVPGAEVAAYGGYTGVDAATLVLRRAR